MTYNFGAYGTPNYDFGDYRYIPDSGVGSFNFVPVFGAELSTPYESNIETITGTDDPFDISITDGEYRIDGGAYTSASGSIAVGQTVQLRVTSNADYSRLERSILTIDGVSESYVVFTKGDPNAELSGEGRMALRLGLGL